ncbi:hypothetical protein, partial [Xanthomonas citri]|uniref:hypothetical protein n=1 Tax=Xanthomonas citri TaxID=346 RepID=UPI001ADA2512
MIDRRYDTWMAAVARGKLHWCQRNAATLAAALGRPTADGKAIALAAMRARPCPESACVTFVHSGSERAVRAHWQRPLQVGRLKTGQPGSAVDRAHHRFRVARARRSLRRG